MKKRITYQNYSVARHSFGTNLIVNENIPTFIVGSIMGNSERVLTERYEHVAISAQSIAINLYSDMIFHDEVL